MAKKKRKTRKQLLKEPDEFFHFSSRLIQFGNVYRKQILYILSAVIIIFLAASVNHYYSNKAADDAFTMLKQAQLRYEGVLKDKGAEIACLEMAEEYEGLFKKYSNREGGKIAKVVYANICYQGKKYNKAIELYKESLKAFKHNTFFENQVLSGIGHSYEKKKDYANALKYFEMIVTGSEPVMSDKALYNIGLIYDANGEKDKSRDAFKRIIKEKENSMHIEIVKENVET